MNVTAQVTSPTVQQPHRPRLESARSSQARLVTHVILTMAVTRKMISIALRTQINALSFQKMVKAATIPNAAQATTAT